MQTRWRTRRSHAHTRRSRAHTRLHSRRGSALTCSAPACGCVQEAAAARPSPEPPKLPSSGGGPPSRLDASESSVRLRPGPAGKAGGRARSRRTETPRLDRTKRHLCPMSRNRRPGVHASALPKGGHWRALHCLLRAVGVRLRGARTWTRTRGGDAPSGPSTPRTDRARAQCRGVQCAVFVWPGRGVARAPSSPATLASLLLLSASSSNRCRLSRLEVPSSEMRLKERSSLCYEYRFGAQIVSRALSSILSPFKT